MSDGHIVAFRLLTSFSSSHFHFIVEDVTILLTNSLVHQFLSQLRMNGESVMLPLGLKGQGMMVNTKLCPIYASTLRETDIARIRSRYNIPL